MNTRNLLIFTCHGTGSKEETMKMGQAVGSSSSKQYSSGSFPYMYK